MQHVNKIKIANVVCLTEVCQFVAVVVVVATITTIIPIVIVHASP